MNWKTAGPDRATLHIKQISTWTRDADTVSNARYAVGDNWMVNVVSRVSPLGSGLVQTRDLKKN